MLVSKAYMMYQKFLSENAHLRVCAITEEKKSEIKQKIDALMNKLSDEEHKRRNSEDEADVSKMNEIIDYLLVTIEESLAEHLFLPFLKTDNYKQYKKTNALTAGLNSVSISADKLV